MAKDNAKPASIYSVSSIKKTTNNKLIDASPSLLAYVTRLPEYSCKSVSSELLKNNSLTKPSAECHR